MSPSAVDLSISEETTDELLYAARANELPTFISTLQVASAQHSTSPLRILKAAVDEASLNTPVHYAAANGHVAILEYVASLGTDSSDSACEDPVFLFNFAAKGNDAGNTPVHYAALNGQLAALKIIVSWLDTLPVDMGSDRERRKMKMEVLTRKNRAGRDAVFEAVGSSRDAGVAGNKEEEDKKKDNETEEEKNAREEQKKKEEVENFLLEVIDLPENDDGPRGGEGRDAKDTTKMVN